MTCSTTRAAKRHLTPDGFVRVLLSDSGRSNAPSRLLAERCWGIEIRMRDVIPRAGLKALFSLFACRHLDDAAECVTDSPLVVRGEDGELSEAMQQVRRSFGFAG